MWHRHAGLLEFHCVVSTFIWSHLLPLNLFKRLNVPGNETGLSGQITPDMVYTRHRLHQTWFTPNMVETIAAAIIRRLATKDCKTPRNYALNDDTGTPSSQNYKANSNQSV